MGLYCELCHQIKSSFGGKGGGYPAVHVVFFTYNSRSSTNLRSDWKLNILQNIVPRYEAADSSITIILHFDIRRLIRLMTWHNARSTNSNVSSQLNTKSKDYSKKNVSFSLAFSGKSVWLRESPVSLLAVISLLRLINDYILPTVQLQQPPSRPTFGCQQSTHTNATTLFTHTSWHNSQTDDGCCFRAPSHSQVIDSLPRLFPQVIYSFNLIGVSEL